MNPTTTCASLHLLTCVLRPRHVGESARVDLRSLDAARARWERPLDNPTRGRGRWDEHGPAASPHAEASVAALSFADLCCAPSLQGLALEIAFVFPAQHSVELIHGAPPISVRPPGCAGARSPGRPQPA